MTQTGGNSSRLDRIEAILERTVSDQAELRGSLIQLTKRVDTLTQQVTVLTQRVDTLTQRVDTLTQQVTVLTQRVDTLTEQVTVLTQRVDTLTEQVTVLTQRVDNLVERMIRFEEKTDNRFYDLNQGQKETIALVRQVAQELAEMRETQSSMKAGQERQERILDYLLRRIDGQDADS